jgi:hypothetical protein
VETMPSETTPATEAVAVKPDDAAVEAAPRATAAAEVVTRPPARARLMKRSNAISLAAIVIVLASLALPRRPMPADTPPSAVDPQPQTPNQSTGRDSSAHPIVSASTAAPASGFIPTAATGAHPIAATRAAGDSAKNALARPAKNLAAVSSEPILAATPAVETHAKEDSLADDEPTAPVPASALSTVSAALAQVTITGCLEVSTNDDRFRLADTDGTSAPKSRSWRTGFLKKRSAPVDLVGPSDALALEKQVGKRVAATGVLTSRELKVTSVRTVSPSCN